MKPEEKYLESMRRAEVSLEHGEERILQSPFERYLGHLKLATESLAKFSNSLSRLVPAMVESLQDDVFKSHQQIIFHMKQANRFMNTARRRNDEISSIFMKRSYDYILVGDHSFFGELERMMHVLDANWKEAEELGLGMSEYFIWLEDLIKGHNASAKRTNNVYLIIPDERKQKLVKRWIDINSSHSNQ